MSSKYTKYDQYVVTAFGLFGDLRVSKDVYASLFEKKLHPNNDNAFKSAKDKSVAAITNKCPKATKEQVDSMAGVVLHLASQCKYAH